MSICLLVVGFVRVVEVIVKCEISYLCVIKIM